MRLIFKTEMLIYQAQADLDEKILFGKITHHLGPEVRNMLVNGIRPFSYSEKESQSNNTPLHFVEFSHVHNSDRNSNATRSNLVYKNV